MLFVLYGILTLTLCGGDAFHLVPRIIRAAYGSNDKIKRQLGIGLQVSSITMTIFYIILMYIWKFTFLELIIPAAIEAIIWISAVVRIVICMFPQNNWCTDEGNMKLSVQEVDALIGELLSLDNPYHCPHGRPTIIAMTKRELEKKFKRIV